MAWTVPDWITTNLRDKRSLKTFARCWLASWAAFVLLLPNKSLQTLGNAAFFAAMASVMLPPNMPVQLFLLAASTLMIGLLFGWGLGCAAMRASLAARNQLLLKESLKQAIQRASASSNPDAEFQNEIFQGNFLDTNASIVFGVFLAFTTFMLGLIRAYAPNLILFASFATIAIDVMCSFGPLFPFAEYTVMNTFLISSSSYIAIGTVVIIVIFPQTISHQHMHHLSNMTAKMCSLLEMQEDVLTAKDDELLPGSPLIGGLAATHRSAAGIWQSVQSTSPFLNLEWTWAKWCGDDLIALEKTMLALLARTGGLVNFATILANAYALSHEADSAGHLEAHHIVTGREPVKRSKKKQGGGDSGSSPTSPISPRDEDGENGEAWTPLKGLYKRQRDAEHAHAVRLHDVLPILASCSRDLRSACVEALASAQAVVDGVNHRRWHRSDPEEATRAERLDASLTRLRTTLAAFRNERRLELLAPYAPLFEVERGKRDEMPMRSLFIAYVFVANLSILSTTILAHVEALQAIVRKRTKSRLWAPKGLRALAKAITARGVEETAAAGEDVVREPKGEESDERSYKLDPDSKPPTNGLQKLMNAIHGMFRWSKTPEAMFCYKYSIISVLLWLPSVFKHSASFNYVQKGLWALIMAQTSMNIYASDQIFNLVTRLLGTFFGAVVGLACWYIGNGNGHGNVFGTAAVMAVAFVPIVFIRLFVPPQYLTGGLMGCVTVVLVMGFSWVDARLPTFGNPGVGWPIAWKRMVLVIIGCFAAFIMMYLPPKSGRKAVRLRNAAIIDRIAHLYTLLTARMIAPASPHTVNTHTDDGSGSGSSAEDEKQAGQPDSSSKLAWRETVRGRIIELLEQLAALRQQTAVARWEGSVRGAWPAEEYDRLVQVESVMVASLAQLGGALGDMDDNARLMYLQHMKIVNPHFLTDVMSTFTMVSQSLRTGEPLHQVLHARLLERLFYHGETGRGTPQDGFDLEEMKTMDYTFYATGVVAVLQLVYCLDELHAITRRLCGEIPLDGFGTWKQNFDLRYTKA